MTVSRAAEPGPSEPPTPAAPPRLPQEPRPPVAGPAVPALDLVIDVPAKKVALWGAEVRGRGPKGFQPQLFFALAALADKAGEVVSMADLALAIQQLGGLPRKPVAPDARDLRYRLLRRLRVLLADHARTDDLESLIENVAGCGLRLNCAAQVLRSRDEILG